MNSDQPGSVRRANIDCLLVVEFNAEASPPTVYAVPPGMRLRFVPTTVTGEPGSTNAGEKLLIEGVRTT